MKKVVAALTERLVTSRLPAGGRHSLVAEERPRSACEAPYPRCYEMEAENTETWAGSRSSEAS